MMSVIKQRCRSVGAYLQTFLKWTLCAVAAGLLCGTVGAVFHLCVNYHPTARRTQMAVILFAHRRASDWDLSASRHAGTRDEYGDPVDPFRGTGPAADGAAYFVSTVLSHLCGASVGRRSRLTDRGAWAIFGPISPAGGKRSAYHHVRDECGVFNLVRDTVTAAIFSMEVISVGIMYYVAFLPCILSALIAHLVTGRWGLYRKNSLRSRYKGWMSPF